MGGHLRRGADGEDEQGPEGEGGREAEPLIHVVCLRRVLPRTGLIVQRPAGGAPLGPPRTGGGQESAVLAPYVQAVDRRRHTALPAMPTSPGRWWPSGTEPSSDDRLTEVH